MGTVDAIRSSSVSYWKPPVEGKNLKTSALASSPVFTYGGKTETASAVKALIFGDYSNKRDKNPEPIAKPMTLDTDLEETRFFKFGQEY